MGEYLRLTVYKVVFGEVLDNKGLIREIENLATQADKPIKDVTIVGMLFAHLSARRPLTQQRRLRSTV